MRHFIRKIVNSKDENIEYEFECYENTEPINMGDKFLFFFGDITDIGICDSERSKTEINQNDRVRDSNTIDLVTGFWQNCFKIKSTDFNFEQENYPY